MRPSITALAGLFLSATLLGCGGTTIPQPPSQAKEGPPPGSSDEMLKAKKGAKAGGLGPAAPGKK